MGSDFAPIRTVLITPRLFFEYHGNLTIGNADEMRARFKPIALKHLAAPAKTP
jgi:hypothetical protein